MNYSPHDPHLHPLNTKDDYDDATGVPLVTLVLMLAGLAVAVAVVSLGLWVVL